MALKFNPFTGNFDIVDGIGVVLTEGSVPFGGSSGGLDQDNSNLFWDNTEKLLGVQTNDPQNPVHINANVGATINSVVTASAGTATESLNASPTGAVTLIGEFAALSGSSTSQDTGGTGFTANGQFIEYRIFQGISVTNGTVYVSSLYEEISFTDTINDGVTQFSINLSITTADSNTTHLLIKRQVNGGGYNDEILIVVNGAYTDSGFSGSPGGYTAWPSYYMMSFTSPSAGNSAIASEIDIGSGSLNESGTTYDYEIRSAANVGGIYYCEQTGTVGTPFTDANAANLFNLQIDWTPGTGDDQVIRISTDAGSSWTYAFVGGISGQYIYSGQANSSDAEAAWSRDVSTAQVQYAFKAYARNTAPGGTTVYTGSADTYYGTITTANTAYIFKHVLTGFNTGAKILADYNSGVTNGLNVSNATLIEAGFTTWGDGTTVTPNTYAFSSGVTRYFKLVGYNGTIYSATPLVVNATTSGTDKYFSGTFSYPSGVTVVKILLSTDGSSYTVSKTFNSPTTTFTYDSADTSWVGNTTITPTAVVPSGLRVDRAQSSSSDAPQIVCVEPTGSGTRYMGIGFGASSGVASAPTIVSNIVAEVATGYLRVGAGRVVGYTTKDHGTESWHLGTSVAFNLQKSNSVHPTIWGGDANTPMMYAYSAGDSNRGTVYFGDDVVSYGSTSKVVISPSAGGTTSLHFRHATGAETTAAILIDQAGTFKGLWAKGGRMGLNTSTVSSTTWLLIGADSSGAQLRLAAQSGFGSVAGDIWHDSTSNSLNAYVSGVRQYDTRSLFTQTNSTAVANTITETSFLGGGVGTATLPANFFVAGKTIKIKAYGFHSSTGSPTLTIKVKLGSTVILTTGAHTMHNDTNEMFEVEAMITCRTTGGSGTVFGQGSFSDYGTGGRISMVNTAATTVATNSSQTITITAQWSVANAGNTITGTSCTIVVLN